ncbi:hypothetical protein OCU04_007648 [Sclerotinia nivalis]|uniref:Uncharacterized protein n=1 Tax=Sclerotinia nivalis TaxID=352851 RepID=A0A9X0AJ73_9HELO|nr:hypothetical protein OCU04_007648 [Sclerotinia nivalis]
MKQKVTAPLRTLVIGDSNPYTTDDADNWQKKFFIWNQNLYNAEYYNKNSGNTPTIGGDDLIDLDTMKQKR